MNDLVSIVLAVYNAEAFLKQGLDSVLNQTHKNIEVIAVDDCSKDSSLGILNNYASKDSRVKIIQHDKNQGPGPARNSGIAAATGNYIAFLDPDDLFSSDAIEKLLSVAKQYGSDMVKGTSLKMNHSGEIKGLYSKFVPQDPIYNTTILDIKELWMSTEFWSYLYEKEVLEGITFPEIRLGEDFLFLLESLHKAKKISIIPDTVHKYRQNPSSLTSVKSNYSDCMDAVNGYKKLFKFLRQAGLEDILEHRLYYQTKLLMSTFVGAASQLSLEECSDIFSVFQAAIIENNLEIIEKSQPHCFIFTCLLLKDGHFETAYLFLKRFNGRYRERYITNVYKSLAWESYKIRLRRKFRKIPLLNRIFE